MNIKKMSFVLLLVGFGAFLAACDDGRHHEIEIESKPGKLEIETK